MDHGLDMQVLAVVAGCVVVWGLVSARMERISVTAPIAFVLLGLVVSNEPLSFIDIGLRSSSVREIAEITLALVLFADASRVNLSALRADIAVPARLLGIGLPLTIAAGTVAALLVAHGDVWLAALIAASVAPTDAALGASIMHDERVPARVRRILNVESGLNDGIATPFVPSSSPARPQLPRCRTARACGARWQTSRSAWASASGSAPPAGSCSVWRAPEVGAPRRFDPSPSWVWRCSPTP
jgi:Kef-type K+ transport system membrane component KefB